MENIEKVKQKLKEEGIKNNPKKLVDEAKEAKQKEVHNALPVIPVEALKVKKKDKLVICGFAASSKYIVNYGGEFDKWGLNELYLQFPKVVWDAWWEQHDPYSPSRNYPTHHAFLKETPLPLLMQKKYQEFPSSIAFPIGEVVAYFNHNFILSELGASFTEYSNSISYMIGFGIMLGYKEIHILGVDMAADSEYHFQRPSCNFFIGYAAGKGIKVLIPKDSELCKFPRMYGYESDNYYRSLTKTRITTLGSVIQNVQIGKLSLQYERNKKRRMYEEKTDQCKKELAQIDIDLAKIEVAYHKNEEYLKLYRDPRGADIPATIEKQRVVLAESKEKCIIAQKGIQGEMDKIALEDYVNDQSFQDAVKQQESSLNLHKGSIGECKYNLANNLV